VCATDRRAQCSSTHVTGAQYSHGLFDHGRWGAAGGAGTAGAADAAGGGARPSAGDHKYESRRRPPPVRLRVRVLDADDPSSALVDAQVTLLPPARRLHRRG
jgi:hypothetical protein